jgi:hypothetical protein
MKKPIVIITVCIRDAAHAATGMLTLKSVRVGFPTANIFIIDNASEKGQQAAIATEAGRIGAEVITWEKRLPHYKVFEKVFSANYALESAPGTTVFLDSDVVFFKSCEDWRFNTGLAGMLIPQHLSRYTNTQTASRLHTSFLVVEPELMDRDMVVAGFAKWDFADTELFRPQIVYTRRVPMFYDTCANLFHMVGGTSFIGKHYDCYEHIFCGSSRDYAKKHLPPELWDLFDNMHQVALTEPEKLRGFNSAMVWD